MKDYDVCEFWRFYKQEEDREKDNHQKNGGYARSLCTVFLRMLKKIGENPFDIEKLNQLAHILELTKEEKNEMLNLAGKKRKAVAPDLPEYIMQRDYVSAALRTAQGFGRWRRGVEAFC